MPKKALDYDFKEQSEATQAAYQNLADKAEEVKRRLGSLERTARQTQGIPESEIKAVSDAHLEAARAAEKAQYLIVRFANSWFE